MIFGLFFEEKRAMQARLDEVKVELQTMISHWRQEWKDAVNRWSEKIVVDSSEEDYDDLIFPIDNKNYNYCFIQWNQTSLASDPSAAECNVQNAKSYYRDSREYLAAVPINLAVDIYRHLFVAFGGVFEEEEPFQSSDDVQWLWLDKGHKRHRQAIRESLSPSGQLTNNSIEDDWLMVVLDKIVLGGKLQLEHYIVAVVGRLVLHQVEKMIEYYFRSHSRGGKITQVAKRFWATFTDQWSG